MRITVAILSLAATGSLAAGCGSNTYANQSRPGGGAQATSAQAKTTAVKPVTGKAITKARAIAFAHAVNLRASDVPGLMLIKPEGENKRLRRVEVPAQCPHGRVRRAVMSIHSATFAARPPFRERISSSVRVKPSTSDAIREITALRGSHGRVCLTQALRQSMLTRRVIARFPGSVLTVSPLRAPALLKEGYGWRASLAIGPSRPGSLTLYMDTFDFASGPAEIEFFVEGTQLLPQKTERTLLSRLQSRAVANAL